MKVANKNYFEYAKELFNLALPMIMGNIGFVLILSTNVFVAGRYSTHTLAAVSIGVALTSCIFMFGIGLLASISPILSNKLGEKQSAKQFFYPTINFAMICAAITTVLIIASIALIDKIGFEESLMHDIKIYTFILAFSTFGAFLQVSLKEFLQAYEIVLFPNVVTVLGVFVNLVLNWIFVFGYGSIPSLGIVGLGITNVLMRFLMGGVILIYCLVFFKFNKATSHSTEYYKSLLKIGLPISFAVSIEFLAFNGVAIIMGKASGLFAAAQNIISTLTNISFMIPLAISNAIAVKVGFSNGAKNFFDLKRYAIAGCGISISIMAGFGLFFGIFPKFFACLFTNDLHLINIIIPIMIIVASFQIFDGLQISLSGIFKGLKHTNIVVISNFIWYLVFSLPFGCLLAFNFGLGLKGFWISIAMASMLICLTLGTALLKIYPKIKIKNLNTEKDSLNRVLT